MKVSETEKSTQVAISNKHMAWRLAHLFQLKKKKKKKEKSQRFTATEKKHRNMLKTHGGF